jgi:hypothetical protein
VLCTKKKEEINQKTDLELLVGRGLKTWEGADGDLREARKQARTEAGSEFFPQLVPQLDRLVADCTFFLPRPTSRAPHCQFLPRRP